MSLKLVDELKDFRLESDLPVDLPWEISLSRDIPFTPSLVGWAIINQFYSKLSDADKRSIQVSLLKWRVE